MDIDDQLPLLVAAASSDTKIGDDAAMLVRVHKTEV